MSFTLQNDTKHTQTTLKKKEGQTEKKAWFTRLCMTLSPRAITKLWIYQRQFQWSDLWCVCLCACVLADCSASSVTQA